MRKFVFAAVLVAICGLNAAGQFAAMHSGFDNQIVNSHAPKSSDAFDYVERAVLLSHGHLAALGDAHRSPGYPLFLTIFQPLAQPQFDARIAQLALTALLPFLFALILRSLGFGPIIQIGGALTAAIYPCFYFFTPTLYAEAISLVAATLLMLALARLKPDNVVKIAVLAGILLTILIYLKTNHLVFAAPVAVFGLAALPSRRGAFLGVTLGVLILGMAPWAIFASAEQHAFVPLTASSGFNLWWGSGSRTPSTDNTLPDKIARRYGFYDQAQHDRIESEAAAALAYGTESNKDQVYEKEAIALWKSRPRQQIVYGAAKALHSFGFSLRGPADFAMAFWTLLSLSAAGLLFAMKTHRAWAGYLLTATAASAAQAFIFNSDQRFKLVLFDPAALLVVGLAALALSSLVSIRVRSRRGVQTAAAPSGEWSLARERLRSL